MPQVKNNFKKEEKVSSGFKQVWFHLCWCKQKKKKLDINNMGVVKETSDIILSCLLQTYHHPNTNK